MERRLRDGPPCRASDTRAQRDADGRGPEFEMTLSPNAIREALAAKLGRPVSEQEFDALCQFVRAADRAAVLLASRPEELEVRLDELAESLALEIPGIDAASVKAWIATKARRRSCLAESRRA